MLQQHPILRFYVKFLLLSLPLTILIGYYVIRDPFMALRHYDDYDHSHVTQNEGAVAWQKYLMQRSSQHYDAFLMGTSCTMAFSCKEWNHYTGGHGFRFFSNAEGLGDFCLKLEALDKQPQQPVKNLLLVVERFFFEKENPQGGIMHLMPPDVSHRSWLSYQSAYLQSFFDPKYLLPYLTYEITGHITPSMQGIIIEQVPTRDRITNEAIIPLEDSIRVQGERFWSKRQWKDEPRHPSTAPQVIAEGQIRRLREVVDFCHRHHTRIDIVISPNFDQEAFNPHDLAILRQLFGAHHVFDYTSDTTMTDYHQYYDPAHYRPVVANRILKQIYAPRP